MKTAIFVLIGALVLCFGAVALADGPHGPVIMTDTQMDNVVAADGYAYGQAKTWTNTLAWNNGGQANVLVGYVYSARPRNSSRGHGYNAYFYND